MRLEDISSNTNIIAFRKVRSLSDFIFGNEITNLFFNDKSNCKIERSKKTKKIKFIYHNNNLLFILRPTSGYFALTLYSAQKIIDHIPPPKLRAIVQNDVSEFIKKGRNVFCKHLIKIDENLRPNDEVIVVNENDKLLGIGKLKLPVDYLLSFDKGVGIKIRKGNK